MTSITDVPGIRVGHDTDTLGVTGCTVVLCEGGAVGGVDVRGGAPGTRETDLLRPENTVERVHAVLLTGGSAFGLDAATGVLRYLEARGVGFQVGPVAVPIVPGAVLFDLLIGDASARPNAQAGERACLAATVGPVSEGSVGAGTGATVGKGRGGAFACKGGVGTASLRLADGVTVGAIIAANAAGDIVNHETGQIVAGARLEDGSGFVGPSAYLDTRTSNGPQPGANTTIGVVATDATLTKSQATRLAQMAHDGLALTIRPCHTPMDGDVLFALALGRDNYPYPHLHSLGVAAVTVVAEAVLRAVRAATGLGGTPSVSEL